MGGSTVLPRDDRSRRAKAQNYRPPVGRRRIFVAQAISSLTNGVYVFAAAFVLARAEFNEYALVQLVAVTALAFQRALLIEPAVALRDDASISGLRTWWGASSAAALGLGATAVLAVCTSASSHGLWVVVVAIVGVLLQDYFRYLCITTGRVVRVWAADGTWLILSVGALVVARPSSVVAVTVVWGVGAWVSLGLLVLCRWDWTATTRLAEVLRLGRFQGADYLVAQVSVTVPLLVVGALYPLGPVGALRLAQTLLGPLAIWFTAVSTDLLLRSADLRAAPYDAVVARVRRLARHLLLIAAGYTAVVVVGIFALRPLSPGQLPPGLALAVLLTGVVGVATGWSGAFGAALRAVRGQARAARVRIVCALVAGAVLVLVLPTGRPWVIAVLPSVCAASVGVVIWPRELRVTLRSRPDKAGAAR